MDENEVYNTIEAMRQTVGIDPTVDMEIVEKLCNYMQSNVDDFIECCEDEE